MTKEDPDQLINVGPYLVPIGQLMSALGQKRTFRSATAMSALPPKADMKWQFATCGA
jgi:hypothetical protein